jgi:predicted enzyme related to lactoylglutathione lyase
VAIMQRCYARAAATAVILLTTVAAAAPQPAGRQTGSQPKPGLSGQFVWHDLVTDNPALCRAFYAALLGWTFEPSDGLEPGYMLIKQGGLMIGGIAPAPRRDNQPVVAQWLSYVQVADVDKTVDVVRRDGGRVLRAPLNARKDLRVAVVQDPQGAPIGLASRAPVVDDPASPALNRWLWMEYVARDPDAALRFYHDTIGFDHQISESRQDFTYYLLTTDRPHAGLFRSPWPHDTSAWLPYVRVADPAAAAARAVELGGTIVLSPRAAVRNGSLAIVLDPTGAPLALQKVPFQGGATQ